MGVSGVGTNERQKVRARAGDMGRAEVGGQMEVGGRLESAGGTLIPSSIISYSTQSHRCSTFSREKRCRFSTT